MLLDASALLLEARDRAGLTQAELATRAGTSAAAVSRYEGGRRAPTTSTLIRLLAAAGLQARCELEPLLADVDERVDALLAGTPAVELERVDVVARSFSEVEPSPVRWALDGMSALACQGIGGGAEGCEWLVLLFDDAAKRWMTRQFVTGSGPAGRVGWFSATTAEANASLGTFAASWKGAFRLRVVDELPSLIEIVPPGGRQPFPVLPLEAVEDAHPELAEMLVRWRARREQGRRTVGE